jgi:hypothetical protein
MEYLCYFVHRCSNIACMGSLDESMLNLQLYKKLYFVMVCRLRCLCVMCIVALRTFWSVRGVCVFSRLLSCLAYILRCSCRIYMIL